MIKIIVFLLLTSSLLFGQQTEKVDFLELNATVTIDTLNFEIKGQVEVSFKTLIDADSVYLDAVDMRITPSESNTLKIVNTDDKIWMTSNFKKDKSYSATFSYECEPKQALYFVGFNSTLKAYPSQVWTQGQGKYTSHWLPSLDDMNDKVIFSITYEAPENYEVIANGHLNKTRSRLNHKSWHYEMQKPMSSYLVGFCDGRLQAKRLTKSKKGIPLQVYLEPDTWIK